MSGVPLFAAALSLASFGASSPSEEIVVHRRDVPADAAQWRASLHEGRPALRGFRVPLFEPTARVPIDLPGDARLRAAAVLGSQRLAREGLVATTAAVIEALGVSPIERDGGTDRLRDVGVPVDWLDYFTWPGEPEAGARHVVRAIATAIESGTSAESLRSLCADAPFAFRQSLPGFAVATESGEHEIALVRLQLTSGSYWSGAGDGGSLDLARQLVAALPDADFFASIEEKHLAGLLTTAGDWKLGRGGRLTVSPEILPVAQWAQDSGKPGFAPTRGQQHPRADGAERVLLVPRYASRGEDGATFVPGETFLAEGFASAGNRVVQSPLLFQGGNFLAALDPKRGERVLFVGEADVWRNTALGLARGQVLEAFRLEFGVDRCEILPAVSFHIDQELSLRGVGSELVAIVPDVVAATKLVLACGIEALESAGVLSRDSARRARDDLEAGRDREFLSAVVPELSRRCAVFGHYPESLAQAFSAGAADSGVGNLQRFLFATDLLASWNQRETERALDPHSAAYLRSLRRRDEDRRAMTAQLRRSGLAIERVPSLPDAHLGIDYLNGVHTKSKYLMPSWGGLYAQLDGAAEQAWRRVLGPGIEIVPILSSESQRRGGALHCSVSTGARP